MMQTLTIVYASIVFVVNITLNTLLIYVTSRFFWRLCYHKKSTAFKNMIAFFSLVAILSLISLFQATTAGSLIGNALHAIGGFLFMALLFRPLYIWCYLANQKRFVKVFGVLECIVETMFITLSIVVFSWDRILHSAVLALHLESAVVCMTVGILHGVMGFMVFRHLNRSQIHRRQRYYRFRDDFDTNSEKEMTSSSRDSSRAKQNKRVYQDYRSKISSKSDLSQPLNDDNDIGDNEEEEENQIENEYSKETIDADRTRNKSITMKNQRSHQTKRKWKWKFWTNFGGDISKKILWSTLTMALMSQCIGGYILFHGIYSKTHLTKSVKTEALWLAVPYMVINIGVVTMAWMMSTTSSHK